MHTTELINYTINNHPAVRSFIQEIQMKLYHHPLSGHAHRVRLFLSLLGIEHELVLVDLASKEHKQEPF